MTSNTVCDPCSRLDKSSTAIKFCTDCDESLCIDCASLHSALKALANHNLIEASVSFPKELSIDNTCSVHGDMALEFYCSDHDCLCCKTCMSNIHRTCIKIDPLEVAAKGIKLSALFDDVKRDISALSETISKLEDDRSNNKDQIGNTTEAVLANITNFKVELVKRMDDLERKIKSKIKSKAKMLLHITAGELSDVRERKQKLKIMAEKLGFFNKHGSESQMFILLNAIQSDITEETNSIQQWIPSLKSVQVTFEPSDLISTLKSFGCVKVECTPCQIKHKPPKFLQAQKQQKFNNFPTQFAYVRKIDFTDLITGMIMTTDNKLLVANNTKCQLSSYRQNGQHLQDCKLPDRPWNLALIPNTDTAVVAYPAKKVIQFVNTKTMTTEKSFRVPGECYGIVVIGNKIMVGGNGKVYQMNMTGECEKTLNVGSNILYGLCPGKGKTICCCQGDGNSKLFCVNIEDGKSVFIKHFKRAMDVTTDNKGNYYIVDSRSNSLHRLSPDGDNMEILLKEEDGLGCPWTVSFNNNCSKLFLSNSTSDTRGILFIVVNNLCCKQKCTTNVN